MKPAALPRRPAGAGAEADADAAPLRRGASTARPRRDADGMAVASFVLGLVGLLVLNVLLGPMALCLAVLALRRGTRRRGRAFLGLALGAADLALLAVLATADGTVSWHPG
ncbi:DUF4190 domain-containing protein [Streptomyces fradiae]|uniref:DUF4190 domain-containing protein n=1 Tax=Streptomyces fradiae TaxID=1906 RepID=UPI00294330E6|nr:DUF4190 domain-containing protein [Streptomyces fradiae]WOI62313.1 DUF4190 domain-containing protein [Streptomyces fradiae]